MVPPQGRTPSAGGAGDACAATTATTATIANTANDANAPPKPALTSATGPAAPPARRRGRPRGARTRLLHEAAGSLGRHHFAFARALLDGIDLRSAWLRYLSFSGGPDDHRHFASRLRQVVATLEEASAQRGLQASAALACSALRALPELRRRGAASAPPVPAAAAHVPSLAEWRARECAEQGFDEDFYSEAEWLSLYADAFGSAATTLPPAPRPATAHVRLAEAESPGEGRTAARPAGSRRSTLAALAALADLERELAREPQLEDPVAHWLGAGLPRDLATVGVRTLGDLVLYVNLHGYRWHRGVPRMGVQRARRLMGWLEPLAAARGRPLADTARRPQTDLALLRARELQRERQGETGAAPAARSGFALVPIVDGALPEALSGRSGSFRAAGPNAWGAETDVQAVGAWLERYRGQTRRDYTRIAERFYLWCVHVRRQALSSLVEADLRAYQAFLGAPPADWVQERRLRREDPRWRPFRGPLGRNSQRREFTVLAGLFSAMLAAGYLRANVMDRLSRTLDLVQPTIDVRRSLGERAWAFAVEVLHRQPDTPQRRRLELLLALGSTTGLRLSELATTRMRGFRRERVDGEDVWLLDVVGKGGKPRAVVVFDEVKALLERHHADMDAAGLGFDPAVARVQQPASAPRTAAAERSAVAAGGSDDPAGWRPLVGILKRPPPRRTLDALGVGRPDPAPAQADRYGALERSALYQSLRRFFRLVAREAAMQEGAPPPAEFEAVSTHWLRHTFANNAIRHMQPQVLQALLGHADLRVTSVYVKAHAQDLVRGMRALRSGRVVGGGGGGGGGGQEPARAKPLSPR